MASLYTLTVINSNQTSQPIKPAQNDESAILERIKRSEPIVSETRLRNGMRFISACVPDFPTASIMLHFDAGSRREVEGEFGGLHFFEHLPPASFRVMNGGVNLAQYADIRDWEINICINKFVLNIGLKCPDFEAGQAMSVVREILNYDQECYRTVFPVEKGRILNEIDQISINPNTRQFEYLCRLIMQNTGYAHSEAGVREEVADYSFEHILNIGQKFISPDNTTIAVSGNKNVIQQSEDFFDNMALPWANRVEPFMLSGEPAWSEIPDVSTHICPYMSGVSIGVLFPGSVYYNERERAAQTLICNALSHALASTLSHEQGITYGAGMGMLTFGDRLFFSGGCNVEPDLVSKATELFMETVIHFPSTISSVAIDEAYLKLRNFNYSTSNYLNYGADLETLAINPHRKYAPISERLRIHSSFTVDELRTLATNYFDPAKARLVFHGSEKALGQTGT